MVKLMWSKIVYIYKIINLIMDIKSISETDLRNAKMTRDEALRYLYLERINKYINDGKEDNK